MTLTTLSTIAHLKLNYCDLMARLMEPKILFCNLSVTMVLTPLWGSYVHGVYVPPTFFHTTRSADYSIVTFCAIFLPNLSDSRLIADLPVRLLTHLDDYRVRGGCCMGEWRLDENDRRAKTPSP